MSPDQVMSEHPQREVDVFNAARKLAGDARAAYLQAACASEPAMRRRLEELLQINETTADFLERPAQGEAGVVQSAKPVAPTTLVTPVVGLIESRLPE